MHTANSRPARAEPASTATTRAASPLVAALAIALVGAQFAAALAGCRREPPQKVEIVHAPHEGDVATYVRGELQRAAHDGRSVLVYVGATWCEPCQRFHRAAESGQLDHAFPSLRILDFDIDQDRVRLQAAGYTSRLIPLFARPAPDGRASGAQIEGSVKGEGAAADIAPRLLELLRGS